MGLGLFWKPSGIGSQEFLAKCRASLNLGPKKKGRSEIGHTGTLDPFASGILCVGWGEGTKLLHALEGQDKTYKAKFILGLSSDTCDPVGKISQGPEELNSKIDEFLRTLSENPSLAQQCLDKLIGDHDQVPPLASAVHLDGVRGHELFRKTQENPELREKLEQEIQKKSKVISILECQHLGLKTENLELGGGNHFKKWTWEISIKVSKGSYIRALARDIPQKFWGIGPGMLAALERTHVGPWGWPADLPKERPYFLNQTTQFLDLFDQTPLSNEEAGALESGGRILPSLALRLGQNQGSRVSLGGGKPILLTREKGIQAWLKPNGEVGRVFRSNPLV